MIIVRIIGGLGNQLFQYALGRHLALIHRTELKLDLSGFERYKLHKYSLWPFNIQEKVASAEELAFFGVRNRGLLERVVRRIVRRPPRFPRTYIREKGFFFDPAVLKLGDGVYLDGHWQSEKYFKNIEGLLRSELTLKPPLEGKNLELAKQIENCEAVSIHVRRGDFISNPKRLKFHGVCEMDYYLRCVERLTGTIGEPNFFVFSDEPEWCHTNVNLGYPTTIVSHNGVNGNYEDLRLMSLCKHHILANSTFSWWGAWLSRHGEKKVFAPRKWIVNDNTIKVTDVIPAEWAIV